MKTKEYCNRVIFNIISLRNKLMTTASWGDSINLCVKYQNHWVTDLKQNSVSALLPNLTYQDL